MTRAEAKTIFLNRGYIEVDGGSYFDGNKWRESITVISEWLKEEIAEPCEDYISRKAALSMQYRIDDSATLSTRDVVNVDDIEDLPPVTPQPKTDTLDKIRAEIEQAADKQFQIAMGVSDLNERYAHIQMENAYRHSLSVIDEYKAESEEV